MIGSANSSLFGFQGASFPVVIVCQEVVVGMSMACREVIAFSARKLSYDQRCSGRKLRVAKLPRWINVVVFAVLLLSSSGCTSIGWFGTREPQAPVVLGVNPRPQDVVAAVNGNSRLIRQLQTTSASLSVPGLPGLAADLALERPQQLRIRARAPIGSRPQLDLGSNQEHFWFWVNQNPTGLALGRPSPVYVARHQDFRRTAAPGVLPLEPRWIIEMLGVATLDPAAGYQFSVGPEALVLRSQIATPGLPLTRQVVVHPQYGWVLQQQFEDSSGTLAIANLSQFRYYPDNGVSLPRRLQIQLLPGRQEEVTFQIDVGDYMINQLIGAPSRLWQMPPLEGSPRVDLADFREPSQGGVQDPGGAGRGNLGSSAFRPRYRGLPQLR